MGPLADDSSPVLQFQPKWLGRIVDGVQIAFEDARGSKRFLTVTHKTAGSVRTETTKTAYVTSETRLVVKQ